MARLVEIDEFIVITSCGHFTMNAFFNQENLAFVGSALFLAHTLTHNRKVAGGFSGLLSKIMDYIDKIIIDSSRQIMVKWSIS